ncbi:hypothetical protein GCM10011611_14520 [Aliidongia dinghuensis]|uniref:Band 7 domain-containing protein n=1 Tax=Aliidongia dinghuensis TaxID=1867774 RepID=A0A8J2YRU8_9PROT|nr:SPFH domain-containing protein [Aliidongia dinghuensis]GGF10068.1 hypothetical protein GCM10011611_14520 [Aliidongia dinghuensis]
MQTPTPLPLARLVITIVLVSIWGWFSFSLDTAATLETGKLAVSQFANTDSGFVSTTAGFRLFSWLGGLASLTLVVLLLWIWREPLGRLIAQGRDVRKFILVPALLLWSGHAFAYYDKNDYTEAYFILPNQSAFYIPDVGDNRDSQGKFGSADYLNANKVAAKRFNIPHQKLSGSGAWSDYYVPAGRLIIVDRTPYNREWVAAKDRGTSARNESIPCQSAEGLNVTVEIAIAASVTEENAAKYLYYFGVKPPVGDMSRPEVIFSSVYFGRSLAETMDSVGRGKVQSIVCQQISARGLDKVNQDAGAIIKAVETEASGFFSARGITIDYIGWAGTFTFDHDVQAAINDRYTAEKIAPVLATLQTKAVLDATGRWDGKLPTTVSGLWLMPSDLWNSFLTWIGTPAKK